MGEENTTTTDIVPGATQQTVNERLPNPDSIRQPPKLTKAGNLDARCIENHPKRTRTPEERARQIVNAHIKRAITAGVIDIPVDNKALMQSVENDAVNFFLKVEEEAKVARLVENLGDEIKHTRAMATELLQKFQGGTATSGYKRDGSLAFATDTDKAKMLCQLVRAIGVLVKSDFDMGMADVITLNSFRVWMGKLAREIKSEFTTQEELQRFSKIAKKVGMPKTGAG